MKLDCLQKLYKIFKEKFGIESKVCTDIKEEIDKLK